MGHIKLAKADPNNTLSTTLNFKDESPLVNKNAKRPHTLRCNIIHEALRCDSIIKITDEHLKPSLISPIIKMKTNGKLKLKESGQSKFFNRIKNNERLKTLRSFQNAQTVDG